MLKDSEANAAARERLSALLDGELEGSAVTVACAHWRESAESRGTWHAYHLIGDVLRSDDLASHPARDVDFLDALRARLATEPVVLAPQPLMAAPVAAVAPVPVAANSRRRWSRVIAPTVVAAGFVAVTGTLTLMRPGALAPDAGARASVAQISVPNAGANVASASITPASTLVNPAAPTAAEPQTFVASGQVIRDARLDRYLAAHKQFAGSSALGVPSAYLRNATAEVAGR